MLYNIENELIEQKNKILGLINDEKFHEALTILNLLEPLWLKVGYSYKAKEIRQRVKDIARQKEVEATHHKTAEKWNRLYSRV